jgi:hypothetical protein
VARNATGPRPSRRLLRCTARARFTPPSAPPSKRAEQLLTRRGPLVQVPLSCALAAGVQAELPSNGCARHEELEHCRRHMVGVFLVGFVPQCLKANRLENALRRSRQENARAQLRDLIGLACIHANQKGLRPLRRNDQSFVEKALSRKFLASPRQCAMLAVSGRA